MSSPSEPIATQYAKRVKARLAKPKIDVMEARDGILDCFLSSYHQGLDKGLQGIADIHGSNESVARFAATLFKQRLRKHGASFDAPTVRALSAVKDEVDQEMHLEKLPAEMKAVHDQVCALFLAKAEGTLGHSGNQTAVRGSATAKPAALKPAALKPAAVKPTAVKPTAATPTPKPNAHPRPSVAAGLRSNLAEWLNQIAEQARSGEDPAALAVAIAQAKSLVDTLATFES